MRVSGGLGPGVTFASAGLGPYPGIIVQIYRNIKSFVLRITKREAITLER